MKKYFIQTFGCSMNYADSEKINMILLQSGFIKTLNWREADLVIFNTCSIRQKGEDRVFGYITEIKKFNELNNEKIKVGVTGCMVRKTGIDGRYLEDYKRDRNKSKKISLLKNKSEIFNNDDKLFPRTKGYLDFTLRIEDIKYLNHILTKIYGENIGNDSKFDDYLKAKQLRENPFSASIVIQTGCDNFCTYCIVPYTRGGENSRPVDEIMDEAREAVKNGAKEITLLGQNVNSYGKQFVGKKYWNAEKSMWNKIELDIGIDLDDTLVKVFEDKVLDNYNKKYNKSLKFEDVVTHNFNGDKNLEEEFFKNFYENWENQDLYSDAFETLQDLKKQGHNLYIITSRPKEDKELTRIYLENKFGKDFFKGIKFTCDRKEDIKYEVVNELNLDIVIEDTPHHIDGFLENTKAQIIVFSKPWNTKFKNGGNLQIAKNWLEIKDIIKDISKSPFRKLLDKLDTIDGLDRIRFTSSNPHDMTADILDAHFELKKTCNYLHFALQSGNNEMLKKMNRRCTYEDFKRMVQYLRKKDPNFSISTDIIVGFSGETDEMFADTVKVFDELEFDFVYNARYSVRKGTIASKMFPDDVTDEIKAKRWHILNDKLLESLTKRNKKMLGKIEEVLISGEKNGQFFGRTRNFKEIYFKGKNIKVGDLVKVKLEKLDKYIIKGSLVK